MNYELAKINLIDDKKSFRIRYSGVNKILFNIKGVYSPFGIENYNKKDILNLELTNNNNDNHNNIIILKQLDDYFKELSNNKKELKDMNYTSPIKILADNKINIRTHLSKKLNFKVNDNQKNVEIKNKKFNIELEFSSIWIYNENYGLVLTINTIELA